MTDLADERKNISIEATQFRSAVSESTFQRVGSSINFINNRQHDTKDFFLNGPYATGGIQVGIDGLYSVPYDIEIIDVMMFNSIAGSSGTTTLDIQKASRGSATFASIFSTTPSIPSSAGNFARVSIDGGPVDEFFAGTTRPVLTTSDLSSGDALRIDTVAVQGGDPENCGIVLYFRPR